MPRRFTTPGRSLPAPSTAQQIGRAAQPDWLCSICSPPGRGLWSTAVLRRETVVELCDGQQSVVLPAGTRIEACYTARKLLRAYVKDFRYGSSIGQLNLLPRGVITFNPCHAVAAA